jgi:hypothetical protein
MFGVNHRSTKSAAKMAQGETMPVLTSTARLTLTPGHPHCSLSSIRFDRCAGFQCRTLYDIWRKSCYAYPSSSSPHTYPFPFGSSLSPIFLVITTSSFQPHPNRILLQERILDRAKVLESPMAAGEGGVRRKAGWEAAGCRGASG